jgi:hypothetical protein
MALLTLAVVEEECQITQHPLDLVDLVSVLFVIGFLDK